MEIAHRQMNRVDLLEIAGRVDAASAPQFKRQLDTLLDAGRNRIVLDLGKLESISSAGLRVLLEARRRARDWKAPDEEGGDIRIANLPPRIREVFDLTGFTPLFDLYDDTVEATGSF